MLTNADSAFCLITETCQSTLKTKTTVCTRDHTACRFLSYDHARVADAQIFSSPEVCLRSGRRNADANLIFELEFLKFAIEWSIKYPQ